MKRRIDHTDIHQLMDEFDTPQIMLQAQLAPTASPAALILAATPSALAPAVKPAAEAKAAATFQPAVKTGHDTVHAVAPKLTPQKQQPPGATAAVVKESQKPNAAPPAATASSDRALAHVSTGPPAPEWVHNPPKRVGDVQREVLVTDEWSSEEECERARNIGLMLNIYEHIQRLSGAPYRGYPQDQRMNAENAFLSDHRFHTLASAGITVDYALREIAKDEYVETSERSFGPMKKMYTLVEFTPNVDRELRQLWSAYERRDRFAIVGVGTGSVLSLLALVFALLKIDTWTRGYYTKRLFIGVPAAIIVVVLLLWADPLHAF